MVFRAFLDGFGDSYTSNWNSFKYNGRGEEFFTYGGFKRTFAFSFKVAAQSKQEMRPLYRKLNYLISNMAPDYSKSGRMRGPYIKLSLGAYMDRTPGFLTSMNIKWQKDYPFEISLNSLEGGEDKEMHVLPHVLDVSCNFTPIHDFVPRKSVEDSPFIIPGANSNLHTPTGNSRKWLSGNNSKFESKEVSLSKVQETKSPIINDDNSYKDKEKEDKNQNTEKGNTGLDKINFYDSIATKVNSLLGSFTYPLTDQAFILPNTTSNRYDLDNDGIDDIQIIISGTNKSDTRIDVNIDSRYSDNIEGGIDGEEIYNHIISRYPDIFKNVGEGIHFNIASVAEVNY